MKNLETLNRVLLGLVLLVPGLIKLFGSGFSGVAGFLGGNFLFSWAPLFWAILLVSGEIFFGTAILLNWKKPYGYYGEAFILLMATITTGIKWTAIGTTSWSSVLLHLAVISNCLIFAKYSQKKK
jgi:uncharacterized membrane protein YphA (DoxX/SURF4 family)